MLPETNSIAPVSPQDKDDYVDFYVSKFRVANDVFRNLNQREKDRLSMIESREPYEVLIAWRSISIEQIQRHYNLMHIEPQIELRSQRGFLSYFSSEKAVALKNQDISTPTSDSHDEKLSDIEKWEKSLTLIDIDISLSKLGLKLMSVDDSYMETILFQISCSFSKSGIESQVRLTLADLSILTNLRDSGNARQMFSTLYGLDRQLPFFQFDFKSKSTLLEDQATLGLKLKKSRISLSNSKLCFILDFFRTPAFGNNTENTEVKNISQSKDSIRSLNSASESTAEKKFVKKESRILLDIVLEAPEFEYFLNPLSSINADVFFLNFGTLTIVGDNQSSKDFVLDFNLSEFEAFVIDSSSVRKGLIESVDNLSLRFCQSSSEGIILDISYDANFVVHVSGYRLGCITKVASQIAKAFSTNASSTQMASKAVAYAAELVDSSKHDSGSEIKLCSTTIVDNSSDPVFCCNFSTNGLIATVHSDSIYKHHASIFVFKNFDCVLSYKADGLFFVHFWLTRMEILSCYSWKPNIAFEKQESEVVAQGPPDDFINDSTRFFHFKYLLSPESSHAIFLNFNVLELRFSPPSMASLAKSLYDFLFEFMHFDDLFEPIEKSNDNAINSSPSVNPSIQEKNIGSFFKISFSLDGIQSIFLSSSNLILANIWSKDININLFSDSHNFDVIFGIGQILVEDPNTLDHKEIFSFNLGKYQKSKWNVDSRYLYWEREECQPENVGAVHINDSVNLSFHSYPKPQIGARIAATSLFINFKFLKSINDWLSCSEFSELREMFLLGNDNVSRTQDSKGSLNLQSQELLNQQSENDVKFLPVLDIIVLSFKVEAPYSSFSKSHFQGLFEGISAITSSSGLCDTIEITTKNLSICILEESMKYSEILNLPYSKLEIRKSPHEENDFEVDFRLRAWKLVLNEDHYKYLMGIYFDNFSAQPFLHQLSKLQSSLACSLPIVSLKSEDLLISLTRISGSKINNKDDLLSYYDGHGHVSGTIQIDLLTSTCPEIAFRLIGQSSLQADLSSGSLSSTFKVNDFTMALLSKTDHNRILKHILQPFSFELSSFSHFAREFDGFWTSLSGSLTPISLLISFRTLMTFMRIFENISSIMNEIQSVLTQIRHSNDELVASVTPAVYSRFWRGTLDDDKAEIFKLFDELKISPSLDQNKEIHSKSSYCIDMFFTFEGIDFVLIDDLIEDYEIPCARFTIWNIDSNFSSFEDFFSFEVSLSFRGFYHNYSLFQWEPLIESSRLSFIMDSSSGYLDKLIILRLNFLKDLNFNVTHGMIETMNQISSLLSQSKDSTLSITRIKTNQVNPYSFINSTQFDLKVTFDVSLFSVNIKADSEAHLCPPLKTLNSGKLGVSLVFPALNSELLKVDLSKIGTFKHVIVTTAFDEVKTLHCFVDVFFSSGVKNMRIRSMFCVQNKTPFVLEVFNLNLVVPSTKDIWLPIGFAEELIISNIRPHQTGSDWAWSKETPLENSNSRLLTCLHNEPSSSPNFWSAIMFRDDSSIMTHSFCITSYLTLQNLLPITVSVKFVEYDTEIINLASSQSYGFYQFENPSLISLSFSFSDPGNAEPAIWSKAYNLLSFLKKKPIDRIIISSKEFEEVSIKVQCQISQNGSISLMLYSEFWVYNLTGLEQPILISEDKNQIFRSKCDPNNYFSQTSVELNFSNLPDEKPLFFSFRASGSTIFLGLEDCSWSEPIPVRAVGSSGSIKLMSSNLEYVYELSLSVSRAPYPFLRTTCIYLTPKYFIRNDLPYPMEVIQTGSPSLFKLKPETILIISRWSNKLYDSREENEKSNDEKCIQIRIKHGLQQNGSNSVECWSEWSHSFNLNAAATFVCRLRQPKNQSSVLSRISILADESRLCMAVRPALEEEVPIRIENCSLETSIYFRQLSMYDWNKLKCYSYQLFSWDEPDMPRVISITLNPFSEGMLDQLDLNPNNFNGDLTFLGRLSRNGISLNFFGQSIGPIKVIVCSPFDTPSLIRIPLYEPSELFELLEKKKTQLQKLVDEIESRQRKSDKEIRNGSDSKPTKGIKLAITVLSARNLPPANWNRTTNAFCTIVIREKIMRSTTIKSLNPKWNDTFLFDFDTAFFNEHHLCMVKIAIFNANFLFEDDFLGGTSVILDVPSTYAIPTKGINRILRLKSYTAVEGFVPEVEIRYRWIEKIDDVYLDNAEEIMSQIEELTDQIHKIESRAKFLNKYQLGSIRRLKSDAVEKSKKTDRRSNLVDFNICVKDIVIPEEILSNFLECDIFCCVDIHRSQSGNLRGICLLAKSKMDHVPVNGSFRFIASEDESVEILFSFFSKNLSHIDYLGDIKIPLETFLSEMRIQKIKTLANGTSCTIHVLRSPIMVVEDEIPHSSLMIDLHGASISFIDRFPKELLYFGLVGLAFRYQDSLSQRTIEFSISKCQLDNQQKDCIIQSILYSTQSEISKQKPVIESSFNIPKNNLVDVIEFNYAAVLIQHLNIEVIPLIITESIPYF